jgi:two-component system, OmpR family, sensor kinase
LIALQKQMTHAISHDIRTPLARLKFSMAIMTNTRQEQQAFTQLTTDMGKDIEEVERLIDEMLTYGRLDTVQSPLTIERVDIAQLMVNLIEKLQRQSDKKLVLTINEPLLFECDGHLLERAIQNIIVNGLRYATRQVSVTVLEENGLEIVIEDDGPGIDPDVVETIFEPFTRLENSRNKTCGGFGLGLSIAAKIVVWHGGEIKVTNSDNHGAIFRLNLPSRPDH